MSAKPYVAIEGGARLAVRLTPRASRNGVDGAEADAQGRPVLHIRLNAPPVDGAANKALIDFLAQALDMRKRDVVIQSGETARHKIIQLRGDGLIAKLDRWLA